MEPTRERSWVFPTVLLCCYGFFKEVRPSEPFLTPYLRQDKNLTEEEVDNQVYPVWTYSYMGALIFVFLLTDLLRYKPVIIFEGISYIATWSLLIWAVGLAMMKLMQFVYGLATSTEIAYFSYIFAVVPRERYQQVSSLTRSALLTGRFVSGALGQILISLGATTYFGLNIISMTMVSVALVISIFLPPVKSSIYFHRNTQDTESNVQEQNLEDPSSNDTNSYTPVGDTSHQNSDPTQDNTDPVSSQVTASTSSSSSVKSFKEKSRTCLRSCLPSTRDYAKLFWADFKVCFTNKQLLQWSLWWAFATCGNFQVGNYIQNLWDIIFTKSAEENLPKNVYNGAVEALGTLLGAISAFLIMFPRVNWDIYGELLLGVVSICDAVLLFVMGLTTNIWLCYSFYIIFRASYQLVITIATFQIAKHLTLERYALVFGWNTFIALVLESILTVIVVDYRTLDMPADKQFLVYGGYFYVLGAAFCFKAIYNVGQRGCRRTFRLCCKVEGECIELSDRESSEEVAEENDQMEAGRIQGNEIDEVTGGDTQQLVKPDIHDE